MERDREFDLRSVYQLYVRRGGALRGSQRQFWKVGGSPNSCNPWPNYRHFHSEPIGDGVDGDNFITDLAAFHTKMNSFGIPVGISEDWDRPGTMSSSDDSGLGDTGTQVKVSEKAEDLVPR